MSGREEMLENKTHKIPHTLFSSLSVYLLPGVQFADEQVEQVKDAAVEEQVDEAQHGRGTHHLACEVSEPHHRLNDSHRDQVEAWEGRDHGVPLKNNQNNVRVGLTLY